MTASVDPNGPALAIVPSNPAPEGVRVGMFDTTDKVKLRYATFPKSQGAPRGTVCLVQGRTEFIEKYFETIANFQSRGFAVATFDWRGQGGSQRLTGNRQLGHVRRFDDYWTDLASFHKSVLLPDCPAPYYLVGHSMGGLAALFAATRDRMMFERVFLTAPMIGLETPLMPMAGWASLFGAMSAIGLGRLPVGRGTDRPPTEAGFAGNPVTSDPIRYMRSVDVLAARPDLLVGKPSVRWSATALRAMLDAAADSFPVSVKIPVLMLAAARDEVVSTPAIETLGLRMRNGRHLLVPGARHELLMENDAIRGQVLAAFDAFIGASAG